MEAPDSRQSLFSTFSRTFTGTLAPISNFASSTFMPRASTYNNSNYNHNQGAEPASATSSSQQQHFKPPVFVKRIKVLMYNYGSPRVGNGNFATFYDKIVPNSYRVVVDGDIVPALPPQQSKYRHVGTEILIDSVGAGSIIIDPSFVERWLRTHMKSSVAVHSLLVYRKGLLGIKLSAEFMRANANARDSVDPLRLALKVRAHHQVNSILDENAGIAAELVSKEQAEREDTFADEEGRMPSVSDIVEQDKRCFSKDRDSEVERNNSPMINMEMLSPTSEGGAGASDQSPTFDVENPILTAEKRGKRAARLAAALQAKTAAESGDVGLAAQHYAHDVEQMELLQSQMAAMRKPGPVKWISKRLQKSDATPGDSASSKSNKAVDNKASKSGKAVEKASKSGKVRLLSAESDQSEDIAAEESKSSKGADDFV